LSATPLKAEWKGDLLGGVVTLNGKWQDGTPMQAIPNYARMNRLNQPTFEFPEDAFAATNPPGSSAGTARQFRRPPAVSEVWMKEQG
jgi:hypothetical protein